ncbi:brefeldin A-inhibited guanine nucleotide-exchange protein 2 isoform X1 [Sesamum indicum]|uniref:Brefeldin A-inhibited guanine nucleotide-exchange protein 2 isoform X1 n=1 Tax=Sesamum indicum TaxID=4182 RepID=A0A6I9U6C2_SESIN|nr:brefeldin A-inhibited guanine nucleotide-exchange protein 2 isoform X1 [Sesamum indicum]
MASSEADSRLERVLVPALEKIIKNGSWRKHSKLSAECKSVIENLTLHKQCPIEAPASDQSDSEVLSLPGVLLDLSLYESEFFLSPLINALSANHVRVAEPALDAVQKLIAHGYLHGEADSSEGPASKLLSRLIDSTCKCHDLGDENVELLVIKTLLTAVTSCALRIHGDCLLQVVKTCYHIYIISKNVVNQTTAKASLVQMLVIVFRRMEADSSTVPLQPIVVAELMEPLEKADVDGSTAIFVQGFITKIMQDIDGVFSPSTPRGGRVSGVALHDGAFDTKAPSVEGTTPADLLDSTDKDMLDAKYWEISMYKTALEERKGELADCEGERDDDLEVQIGNMLKRDAFLVFRALCKLSMKTPPKDAMAEPQVMKGKILALELLKILLENAGAIFRTSERFLDAIKQYLCLSLLKNSASTLMIIFQLSCSIFISLVSRFRAGLKAEIGVFFPMIVLRVLENVSQPNFQQKMTVLRFLEKLCDDSQILIDIFLNYDCDVNASNIFERMVNGLLKTAQGVPPGLSTTLQPPQDGTMKLEALRCLVAILKCMGDWMKKQLRIPDSHSKKFEVMDNSSDPGSVHLVNGNGDDPTEASYTHPEASEVSDISKIEQRRAYKLELQEGISLFNRKPKKGIEFLINANKVGDSPEEIAAFLKNTSGLNKTLIGDYLGEMEDLPLKVMHAYVDSFDFEDMEFDDAIRKLLEGFRLPGEAQKIDRIMEKFAERYCKCNPEDFISADTAYVLAYSVIMLNTDAHNPMVKNKMSAEDFIRNNQGIDDGKDLPEEYMRSLFERITKNEIKMKEDNFSIQQKQSVNSNRVLGLDSILNIVIRKPGGDNMETGDDLMKHMQEQFKEKARKSESIYYPATDVVILKFMIEACWAPMLAAFSLLLDQSDDEVIIALCLEGFRNAVHVTATMSMKTHRDAFVTSLAKFTSLHSPGDIRQKSIDAIKVIVTIADENGNYLQEAWEHILTCISRFEHLHMLHDGAPLDAAFPSISQNELDKSKHAKSNSLPVLRRKGPGKIQNAASAVRRGSYDSADIGGNMAAGVTSEQINNLFSNLNILEQVGEMDDIFIRSQNLNSEAIVDFFKALCKVSMDELRSTSNPRTFSSAKIIEIAHQNMSRIRLVWSKIWEVLSDFFVTIGCSENLSIAIFGIDSLRQLSMKFLEREELANYNFQNEVMKPFVIVMRKSGAVEIRELIIRCVSQMVLSRVNNVKSGWKSMFMVFTTAAYDDHKNIVLLAFEIIEKIVRDYFPYITETETTTFTDCVNCLIAFSNSRFNKDISLNAIQFLRFCAAKLAEGDLGKGTSGKVPASPYKGRGTFGEIVPSSPYKGKGISGEVVPSSPYKGKGTFGEVVPSSPYKGRGEVIPSSPYKGKDKKFDIWEPNDKVDHLYLWFPLLAGLSELSFDPRPEIRQSALQVLFDTLTNYGQHFSLPLWEKVFESVLFRIFDDARRAIDPSSDNSPRHVAMSNMEELDQDAWLYEICTLVLQLVVDLFVNFYDTVNPVLKKVLMLLVSFIKCPHQNLAGIGITAFVRLMSTVGQLFCEDKWLEVVSSLKEAAKATHPDFSFVHNEDDETWARDEDLERNSGDESSETITSNDDSDNLRRHRLYAAISGVKSQASIQLLLIQAIMEIYDMHRAQLCAKNTVILFEAVHSVAFHAHKINSDVSLRQKLQELGSLTQMQDPPLLRLENESFQICLTFLQNLVLDRPPSYEESEVESYLVNLCQEVLQSYIGVACSVQMPGSSLDRQRLRMIPLGSGRRRELTTRAPLVVAALHTICCLEDSSLQKYLSGFFPLLAHLISCEHGSNEVQLALSDMLSSSVGPVLQRSC